MLEDMDNLTIFTEFLLMEVSTYRELQVLQGQMFLLTYLGTLTGNLLIVTVIITDPHLHSPIYFFIGNLSLIDLCCISVTDPKMIVNSLTDSKLISFSACAAQIFLSLFFVTTEFAFHVVMSYDHYVAICHPLHYGLMISLRLYTQAAGGFWICGFFYSAIHTGTIFRLPFKKSNVIQQYFCDIPQILRISFSNVQFSVSVVLAFSASNFLICFVFLFMSYINIFLMVLKMHSVEVHNKALSTCTPQLAILILYLMSGFTASFGPTANEASLGNFLMAMFYTIVPLFINPIIFSMQNREIKISLSRMIHKYFECQEGFS